MTIFPEEPAPLDRTTRLLLSWTPAGRMSASWRGLGGEGETARRGRLRSEDLARRTSESRPPAWVSRCDILSNSDRLAALLWCAENSNNLAFIFVFFCSPLVFNY